MPENGVSKYAKGWPWGGQHCSNRSPIKPYWYAFRNPVTAVLRYCRRRSILLGRMLEVGCGGGDLGIRFSIHNIRAYFADSSFGVIQACRGNIARLFKLPGFCRQDSFTVCQDMFRLGFKDEVFDLVVSSGVYEHLHEKEARLQFLKESMRVLKKGGCLFTCIPNNTHPLIPYWKRKGYIWLDKVSNPHYYEIELSAEGLKGELAEAGLKDIHYDGAYLWDVVARHPSTNLRRLITLFLKALLPEMTRKIRLRYALMVWAIGQK